MDPIHPDDSAHFQALDIAWLQKWIQPRHLENDALSAYRDRYKSNPMPVVDLPNFLVPDVAASLATFLAREAVYERVYGLYGIDAAVRKEEWDAAAMQDRMYTFDRLTGPAPGIRSFNPLRYAQFRLAFSDPRIVRFFERVTGTALGTVESMAGNAFTVGDYLRPHDDVSGRRRLAYVIYLNPEWEASFGGALHISDERDEIVIEAAYNTVAIFDVHGHRHHFIEKIRSEAGDQRRLTLGGWINDPE